MGVIPEVVLELWAASTFAEESKQLPIETPPTQKISIQNQTRWASSASGTTTREEEEKKKAVNFLIWVCCNFQESEGEKKGWLKYKGRNFELIREKEEAEELVGREQTEEERGRKNTTHTHIDWKRTVAFCFGVVLFEFAYENEDTRTLQARGAFRHVGTLVAP